MATPVVDVLISRAGSALQRGRWAEARQAYTEALQCSEIAAGWMGLSEALWWLGESHSCVDAATRAYAIYAKEGDVEGAVGAAVFLAITYKSNFDNAAVAGGWLSRAERLLGTGAPGILHAWIWLARAYRDPDLEAARRLTEQALRLTRAHHDVDGELVSLSQLGRIAVGRGDASGGLAMVDEAMAAALSGEGDRLDTVVYVCCDMLNACELAVDAARAEQWCRVADDFVRDYGCPFLYAECRTLYGGVLVATGRWSDAARELQVALRASAGTLPALHARALGRLAGLRIRQGRLEEAGQLVVELDQHLESDAEGMLARAALHLASGDGAAASAVLAARLDHLRSHGVQLGQALEMLACAQLATGDLDAATATSRQLSALVGHGLPGDRPDRVAGNAATVAGLLALAVGRADRARAEFTVAERTWAAHRLPFEQARALAQLARAVQPSHPQLAIEYARRALAVFEGLGAALDADEVAAYLRGLGVHGGRSAPRGTGGLTTREREVLALLGHGLSNPEIADRLFISRKTVAHHVSNVLAKLGVRNRAEAAGYAVRLLSAEEAGLEMGHLPHVRRSAPAEHDPHEHRA